jgi:hypothetical protein
MAMMAPWITTRRTMRSTNDDVNCHPQVDPPRPKPSTQRPRTMPPNRVRQAAVPVRNAAYNADTTPKRSTVAATAKATATCASIARATSQYVNAMVNSGFWRTLDRGVSVRDRTNPSVPRLSEAGLDSETLSLRASMEFFSREFDQSGA